MDMEDIRSWLGLIALLISVGTSIWIFITSGAKQTANDLAEFKKADAEEKKALMTAITALGQRTQTLENEMRHLPTRESQHRTELALSEMNGRFAALEEKLKPIAATSERLHELLMEQARK